MSIFIYKPYLTHTLDTHMRTVYLYSNVHLLSIRTFSYITVVLTVVEELDIMGHG